MTKDEPTEQPARYLEGNVGRGILDHRKAVIYRSRYRREKCREGELQRQSDARERYGQYSDHDTVLKSTSYNTARRRRLPLAMQQEDAAGRLYR